MSAMNTYSGRFFDPLAMTAADVCLEDIAHALSLLCRGGGHLVHFYSVAQHSLNCAAEAEARGWSDRLILLCLLHDASEAYLSDVIRPVKAHLSNYLAIEAAIQSVILEHFDLGTLSEEEERCWRLIDNALLDTELKTLMKGEAGRIAAPLFSAPDLSEKDFRTVEKAFFCRAKALCRSL